jgi:hypothetical protein
MGRFFSLLGFAIWLARGQIRLQGNRSMTRQQAVAGGQIGLELRRPDRHCLGYRPVRSRVEINLR